MPTLISPKNVSKYAAGVLVSLYKYELHLMFTEGRELDCCEICFPLYIIRKRGRPKGQKRQLLVSKVRDVKDKMGTSQFYLLGQQRERMVYSLNRMVKIMNLCLGSDTREKCRFSIYDQ